jgi:hypothetical protein
VATIALYVTASTTTPLRMSYVAVKGIKLILGAACYDLMKSVCAVDAGVALDDIYCKIFDEVK